MSLPPEVLKKVKLLEISTRRMVNNIFAGEYHTHFKGQGMTFADFREYVPGDDVRTISWPLTARTGKTFVKTFEEEREMTLVLAVDVSENTLVLRDATEADRALSDAQRAEAIAGLDGAMADLDREMAAARKS